MLLNFAQCAATYRIGGTSHQTAHNVQSQLKAADFVRTHAKYFIGENATRCDMTSAEEVTGRAKLQSSTHWVGSACVAALLILEFLISTILMRPKRTNRRIEITRPLFG